MSTEATSTPRISPLPSSRWSAPLRLLLSLSPGGTANPMNVFATLARHESLFWPWLAFAGKLLAGKLAPRHRELVILRTAHLCGCTYERGHHRKIAREVGLSGDELDAIEQASPGASWAGVDRDVLEAVDELHATQRLSDETWSRLSSHFDERQLIELVMLAGNYHLLAFTLNALRVQAEPESQTASSGMVAAIQRVVLRGKR